MSSPKKHVNSIFGLNKLYGKIGFTKIYSKNKFLSFLSQSSRRQNFRKNEKPKFRTLFDYNSKTIIVIDTGSTDMKSTHFSEPDDTPFVIFGLETKILTFLTQLKNFQKPCFKTKFQIYGLLDIVGN